jgi:hypothetical protein
MSGRTSGHEAGREKGPRLCAFAVGTAAGSVTSIPEARSQARGITTADDENDGSALD